VVLVLRALGLADLLTAVPALRALDDAFPDKRIVLAAPTPLAPLALLTGAVDSVWPTAPLEPLDPGLARPVVGVNLHDRGPQSHAVILGVRPGRLIAFEHPDVPESAGSPAWRPGEHEVVRWCRLLTESGVPADPARLDISPPPLALPPDLVGATVIHPGAASAAQTWPAERWAAVARAELASGRPVIVTGGREEIPLARRVAGEAGLAPAAVWAGRTDLVGLASLVAAAGRLATSDIGVAHLAVAVGTPSVSLLGPSSPAEWGPPADRPQHRVIWTTGLPAIRPAEVAAALAALPGRRGEDAPSRASASG
jgi:ADP-heptose:LPS heptosyltransferase